MSLHYLKPKFEIKIIQQKNVFHFFLIPSLLLLQTLFLYLLLQTCLLYCSHALGLKLSTILTSFILIILLKANLKVSSFYIEQNILVLKGLWANRLVYNYFSPFRRRMKFSKFKPFILTKNLSHKKGKKR